MRGREENHRERRPRRRRERERKVKARARKGREWTRRGRGHSERRRTELEAGSGSEAPGSTPGRRPRGWGGRPREARGATRSLKSWAGARPAPDCATHLLSPSLAATAAASGCAATATRGSAGPEAGLRLQAPPLPAPPPPALPGLQTGLLSRLHARSCRAAYQLGTRPFHEWRNWALKRRVPPRLAREVRSESSRCFRRCFPTVEPDHPVGSQSLLPRTRRAPAPAHPRPAQAAAGLAATSRSPTVPRTREEPCPGASAFQKLTS